VSYIIHHEDGGTVDISIKNDGKVVYECSKCGKLWLGKVTPDHELSHKDRAIAQEAMSRLRALRAQRTER
jgi:DNA-directed RNA polymerase subunit RPC12/RpoP